MPSLCLKPLCFRIATINLMAPAGPFLPWGSRAKGLAAILADHHPDLIGTQEATPEAIVDFQARLPDFEVLGRGRRSDGSGIQCALFFRRSLFRMKDRGFFWLSPTPHKPGTKLPGMGSARVATWAVLESSGRTLSWLNVHFSHLARRPQAKLILKKLSNMPRPWIVTGDFNGTPSPP